VGLTLTRVELTRRLLSPSKNPSLWSGASSSMVAMGVPSLVDEDLEENMPTMRPTMPPPPPVPALGVPLSLLLPPTETLRVSKEETIRILERFTCQSKGQLTCRGRACSARRPSGACR
jgi:hypothetical protein